MSDDNWDMISDSLDLDQCGEDFNDFYPYNRESTPKECVDEHKRLRKKRWEDRKYSKRFKILVTLRLLLAIELLILGGIILWQVN